MKYIWKKLLVLFLVILIPFTATARGEDSIVYLKSSPLINGYTLLLKRILKPIEPGTYCPNRGISIYSDSSSIFSLSCGIVIACFSYGSGFSLMVKSHDTFFVYNGDNGETSLKKGDTVFKQTKIGLLLKDTDVHNYELNFQIWLRRKKSKSVPPIELEPGKVLGYRAKSIN